LYRTKVRGIQRLPSLAIDFTAAGQDEYAAIERHADALRAQGFAPDLVNATRPLWWSTPIFCGWGAQCYLSKVEKGHAPNYARQEHYESFMQALEAQHIAPGILTIDDKWQATYGNNEVDTAKWPDLRGFIDRQHAANRKVLLWLKAWDAEGVPAEETTRNAAGRSIAVDPTNPAFERRLRAQVIRMLAPESYDADGFKIDFSARIPNGPGLRKYLDIEGLELMKLYLKIIYQTAKEMKPEALIIAHTPHPYLADVVDMIRLNDVNTARPVIPAMQHRARIVRIACPGALIDTDNWPIPDKTAWRDYMKIQPSLGVPSLYYATHIDATQEALTAEDYDLIRAVWVGAV
jgi:hypothetical protein